MKTHRKPRSKVSKRPTHDNVTTGERIVRARTVELLWRVAHAARATMWAPETEDCGATAYASLDGAIDDLDAHVRSGCA